MPAGVGLPLVCRGKQKGDSSDSVSSEVRHTGHQPEAKADVSPFVPAKTCPKEKIWKEGSKYRSGKACSVRAFHTLPFRGGDGTDIPLITGGKADIRGRKKKKKDFIFFVEKAHLILVKCRKNVSLHY